MAGATWNCCSLGASSVYTIEPCTSLQSLHSKPPEKCRVYACLAIICHLHVWQNDRDLSRATAVTRGRNGYWNKSQHRKSTLEKKISYCSCRDSNPGPFDHESEALITELSPLLDCTFPAPCFCTSLYLCQFFQIFLENLSRLKSLFFSSIALIYNSLSLFIFSHR